MDLQKLLIITACLVSVEVSGRAHNIGGQEEKNLKTEPGIFTNLNYSFHFGQVLNALDAKAYQNPVQLNDKKIRPFVIEMLPTRPGCLGVTIKTEDIVLRCFDEEVKKYGCFDVINRKKGNEGNRTKVGNENQKTNSVSQVCIKLLDKNCTGIITPENRILLFDCPLITTRNGVSKNIPWEKPTTLVETHTDGKYGISFKKFSLYRSALSDNRHVSGIIFDIPPNIDQMKGDQRHKAL